GAGIDLRGAAEKFVNMGVRFLLVTSIQRDGTLIGPDINNLSKLLHLNANIIASGGVRDLEDLVALKSLGLYGVIVGRALYEGHFSLKEALKIVSPNR
ncbi:1-(5-phosphoribosyl)-5-((5-phosphoribosylamino)methylideneamino)imidazole-4-carboxamide isomerase, partial [Candidatus Bathyarchaeota archaeon]|nr:1-(5-phosphoribosyl)-5-((5-phosphoribosylamino)methylideneamino)imidazole-4-carboxamide isomerase [Candidatus Bathyarchaeota archaeon]